MKNSSYERSALAQMVLDLASPLIGDTLLEEPEFREEYGLQADAIITFYDVDVSVQRSSLFSAIREILSDGSKKEEVTDTKGQKWKVKNISEKEKLPNLVLSRGEQRLSLSNFMVLSPDKGTRLRFLDKAASGLKLPNSALDPWRNILAERAPEDDEVDKCLREFRDTPIGKVQAIQSEIRDGQINLSSLVPPSRRYFERLVGGYDGSTSIWEYAANSGKTIFDQLAAWRPYDGFLFSLLLSSHSSLTDEINVDQLGSEDLVRAYDFLEKYGDRISQLGAIEVGLRVLPSSPEIEQPLIRLIKQIRDDDIEGQMSGFKLLSALFCLVDGQLSKTRLLSAEPPFYRRLAVLSQAALIHRQLVSSPVDIEQFSEWAFSKREGFYMQSLADMRLEPRWDPSFATAFHIRADFFGRIIIAAKKYEQNIKDSKIYDLVLTNTDKSLQTFSDSIETWLPGPLDGIANPQNTLPSEVAEVIETQLSVTEVSPSSFPALINSALLYPIGADHAELAVKALKRADYHLRNIEDKLQFFIIIDGLAKVAAVSRSPLLADELQILVRRYRHDAEYALSIQEVIRICLIAAASRSQLDEWTKFVGDWMTELAFGDLKDEEAQGLHLCLNSLCHAVPELWVSCGRADAALSALKKN